MDNIKAFIETLVTQDYFIILLVIMIMILVVLVMALYKTQKIYKDEFNDYELMKDEEKEEKTLDEVKEELPLEEDMFSSLKVDIKEKNDIIKDIDIEEMKQLDRIANLFDLSDEETAIISNEDLDKMENKEERVMELEKHDEETAIISTDELERRTQDRMEQLELNDSQVTINKYEENQERKAIISYEQLLKNASNISISYKEEKRIDGSPRINKIEVREKDIKEITSYLNEDDFLRDLKAFRASLE